MRRFALALSFAGLSFLSTARADLPPFPGPMGAIPEACKPLIGAWQSAELHGQALRTWEWLSVAQDKVIFLLWGNDREEQTYTESNDFMDVSCSPGENGALTLKLKSEYATKTFKFVKVEATQLTEEREVQQRGAPLPTPPGGDPTPKKPDTYTVTFTRIGH